MADVKTISGVTVDVPAHAAALTATHGITIVRKTANETVNNSTTFQNDDELLLALAANEKWLLEFYLIETSLGAVSDIKLQFSVPNGCTLYWGYIGDYWGGKYTGASPTAILTESGGAGMGTDANTQGIKLIVLAYNGATAGNIVLQWAQNTATVEDTKILANSYLIGKRLA